MKIVVRRAQASEAGRLSEIAFEAKRFWKYPEEWIRLWSEELTVGSAYIDSNLVFVAGTDGQIAGWCSVTPDGKELDYCWVEPGAAGKGVGRQLVDKAFGVAVELKSAALMVIADPNAEGFYSKMGFRRTGFRPSLPAGRKLPVMVAKVTGRKNRRIELEKFEKTDEFQAET